MLLVNQSRSLEAKALQRKASQVVHIAEKREPIASTDVSQLKHIPAGYEIIYSIVM